MAVWMVRAGRHGGQEQAALKGNFVTIHWIELPDLSKVQDKESLKTLYAEATNEQPKQVSSGVGQVWAFRKKIELGHLAVLPLHEHPKEPPKAFAIGRMTGDYCYRTDMGKDIRHTRQVEWIGKPIPATDFREDLRSRLGIPLTVYRIRHNNAEERIQALLRGEEDPGPDTASVLLSHLPSDFLTKTIEAVRAKIAQYQGMKLSEENTKAALINPVLCALGWNVGNLDEVSQEYKRHPQDNPVDYALLLDGNPKVLVEAKALGPGLATKGDQVKGEQIMGYAGNVGVTWVVLTNGDEYRIYNATVPVPFEHKLFCAVRLSDPSSPTEEMFALLSKERIDGLDERWQSHFADRQVRKAIEGLFSPEPHLQLVSLVKKEVKGLTPAQIDASLKRICPKIKVP